MFLLVSGAICSYLVYETALDYLDYEVVTKIRYIRENASIFPTVTICNQNAFLKPYAIDYLAELAMNLTDSIVGDNETKLGIYSSYLKRNE